MKRCLLLLAAVGVFFTACEPANGLDEDNNGNQTEQPGNGNQGGETGGGDDIPADKTQAVKFQDESTKLLCTLHWDENEDGELSYEEAAAVTDLGTAFKGSSILAFTELKYFTSLEKIADSAFEGCVSLVKITLPEQITTIGASAFKNCINIQKIAIPNGITYIGVGAFTNYTGELIIDSKIVESSSNSANHPSNVGWLKDSKFTKLTIGDSITSIGKFTFCFCSSLTSVTISKSITKIGSSAFYDCPSLTIVDYKGDLSAWYNIVFSNCYANPLCNGAKLYINGNELIDTTIPSNITEVRNIFSGCTSLISVIIPDSVTSIGECAFNNCTSLTSVTIDNGVTSIGNSAFSGCNSLANITIPEGITSIGNSAFRDCTSLVSVYCKAATAPIGSDDMFSYYKSGHFKPEPIGCKIYVPAASVEAYKAAQYWSDYASYIEGYDF